MAHDNCIGIWENSRLGGVLEGSGLFEIFSHAGTDIKGRHMGRNGAFLSGKCTGTKIKFCLLDGNNGEPICYIKGEITSSGNKDFIHGKFRKPLDEPDTKAKRTGRKRKVESDDWTAEKTGT